MLQQSDELEGSGHMCQGNCQVYWVIFLCIGSPELDNGVVVALASEDVEWSQKNYINCEIKMSLQFSSHTQKIIEHFINIDPCISNDFTLTLISVYFSVIYMHYSVLTIGIKSYRILVKYFKKKLFKKEWCRISWYVIEKV